MVKRASLLNEVKTRLENRDYDAFQLFKRLNHFDSDSAALARIVRLHLFGALDGMQDLLARGVDE